MIRKALLLAALLAVALRISVLAGAGGEASVLYPPDLTLTTDNAIGILAFRGGEEDPVSVTVNGTAADPLEGGHFLSGKASLAFGLNALNVGGTVIRVYSVPGAKMEKYRSPPGADGSSPLVFQSYRLHPALEDGCEGCHTVEDGKLGRMPEKEACYSCHDDWEKGGGEGKDWYVHAPVADGECTSCHAPHYSERPKLQKLEKRCLECHDSFPNEGSVHRPVRDGECVVCHSPHAGPAPKQLRRAGNDLCLGCHDAPHVQHRSAEVKGKLTVVPSDFPVENGQLSCKGCHLPHQSAERRLFRMKQGEMCQTCHKV